MASTASVVMSSIAKATIKLQEQQRREAEAPLFVYCPPGTQARDSSVVWVLLGAALVDQARRLGLRGWVRNRRDGSVEAMVAAEAASCGCPPLVADHSGLAEIAAGVRSFYPPRLAHLAAFPTGDAAALTERLREYADLNPQDAELMSAGARTAAERLWSWDSVARRLLTLVRPD